MYDCAQIFIGQVLGTSVGTHVFVHFGWRAGAALGLGWTGWQLFILLLRGPHCRRHTWFGYEGGFEARRKKIIQAQSDQETSNSKENPVRAQKDTTSSKEENHEANVDVRQS